LSGFRKVGEAKQFRDGVGRTLSVDGREIAVFRRGDRFHAMDDKCPHMGASLSMGKLVEGKVQCAWHDWKFDLETGCNEFKKWACVAIHEVRLEGEDVLVELREEDDKPSPPANDDDEWFIFDPDADSEKPKS
jgi:nitrite reductase/ring-hydroxylating ferredoxin subunit